MEGSWAARPAAARFGAALIVAAGIGLAGATPAAAVPSLEPRLSITPERGPAPTVVTATVDCDGLAADGWPVTVFAGGEERAAFVIPEGEQIGSVEVTISDEDAPGPLAMVASCFSTPTNEVIFTVEELPGPEATLEVEPPSGAVGTGVVLTGDQLPGCGPGWTARFAGIAAPVTTRFVEPVEADGPVTYLAVLDAVVPTGTPTGGTAVELVCDDVVVASTAFDVTAAVGVPPTSDPPPPSPSPPPASPPPPSPPPPPPSRVTFALPSAGAGVLAAASMALVWRARRSRAGREWAERNVQVLVRPGSVRTW